MDRPPPDPGPAADPDAVARAASRLDRLRGELLGPAPTDPSALARFGLAVLDQFELRPTDLAVVRDSPAAVKQALEVVGRRFLAQVLPGPDELGQLGPAALAEYAAVDPDRPDPGRLAAGYGVARLRRYASDRRLAYRAGGYRGRAGAPLADHLIAVLLDPGPAAPGGPQGTAGPVGEG